MLGSPIMSDNGSQLSRRSSSQTSQASTDSKKNKTIKRPRRLSGSKTSASASAPPAHKHDPSLTSFPSFSPEQDGSAKKSAEIVAPKPTRTVSQKVKDRKATLAGLTTTSPSAGHHNALFEDSPRPSLEVPGSLHLASNEHIERLIARTGALKLIRQYAQDLAQRDNEISVLRLRADNRERELKRLLREADVPTAEVERRLLKLEQAEGASEEGKSRNPVTALDEMMTEAMSQDVASSSQNEVDEIGVPLLTTEPFPPVPGEHVSQSRPSSTTGNTIKDITRPIRGDSRASSVISESSQDPEATLRPRMSSSNVSKVSGLQNMFSPPAQSSSYFIGGPKLLKKPQAGDEVSVRSNNSSRSFASWTQIFGGKSQAGRARASSIDPVADGTVESEAQSALSKLTRVRTNPTPAPPKSTISSGPAGNSKVRPAGRRTPTATKLNTSVNHVRKDSVSAQALTVELDNVLEPDTLPPSMTNYKTEAKGLLIDRFGFIYDQQRRKRQSLPVQRHKKNKLSGAETIASFRSEESSPDAEIERASTPLSIDEDGQKKSWQDYLKPMPILAGRRPTELLSHTPSAGAIVTVNTADATATITPPRTRAASVAVSTANHVFPSSTSVTKPQSSSINAVSTDLGLDDEVDVSNDSPSKLLLEQLNELHDSLQTERMVKWNDFLRRVRAERANSIDRTSNNVPEAQLLDGELVGIATLGRSNKQKAKYTHFRTLVLGGIPVSLRPKIWGECSGATARRIPGYYEDLVARSEEGTDVDEHAAAQIKADVRRTLTDNVFFSHSQGTVRLEEVLRAYSLHNPKIGYCQGMNLIAASLLLICATSDDCFWLLVAVIDTILPAGYFDSLLVARADQIVLRQYVDTILPALSAKLEDLGVELEACTFHWFLSLGAGVLTGGEALYRIWDIILTLHSSEAAPTFNQDRLGAVDFSSFSLSAPATPVTTTSAPADKALDDAEEQTHSGTGSTFLFQLALALLKLNETSILALESPAQVYTYINHNMTNHAISIDALVHATEALRTKVKKDEVLEKRKVAVKALGG